MKLKLIKRIGIKIIQKEWQYLIPLIIILIIYILTDVLNLSNKVSLAYWSGAIIREPFRIITSHFIHSNFEHILSNTFGIIVSRYCINELKINNNHIFLILIALLIPFQTFINLIFDLILFKNFMSIQIGFSGLIYGVEAFFLLCSLYGKKKFLWINLDIKKDKRISSLLFILISIGLLWSIYPGISLAGHVSGLLAGSTLYLL